MHLPPTWALGFDTSNNRIAPLLHPATTKHPCAATSSDVTSIFVFWITKVLLSFSDGTLWNVE
jgi:hypothetical protein